MLDIDTGRRHFRRVSHPPATMVRMFAELIAEVEALDDDGVLRELRVAEAERRRAEARQAALLARAEQRKLFERDRHASMAGLLRASLGWSQAEVVSRMRVARLVQQHPEAGEALLDTSAPVANIAAIGRGFANPRCGDQIEGVLGILLGEAGRLEHADFRRLVERWETITDADGAHRDRELSHENRNAHLTVWDRVGQLDAQWGQADGLSNQAIFEQFLQAEFEADWAIAKQQHGQLVCKALLPRTDAQRRADAVTRIFERAASTPPGSRAPKPVTAIHVDFQTWRDLMVEAQFLPERFVDPFEQGGVLLTKRRCETGDGAIVDPHAVLQATLDGYVRFVVLNNQGIPIHWGRERRLFEGAAREAVIMLNARCTHPGCLVPASQCQAGHTDRFASGGRTDPDRGGPECARHNLDNENFKLTIWRDASGHWHKYHPDGTEIR
jgi:hypothetical protein